MKMPAPRTMADVSPVYLRIAAIANGIFCLAGVFVAAYVYLRFPHPAEVKLVGRFSTHTESVELYLFSYPALQIGVFVILMMQSLRWKTMLSRYIEREASQKAKYPELRKLDAVVLWQAISAVSVVIGLCGLALTIHNAFFLATNSF